MSLNISQSSLQFPILINHAADLYYVCQSLVIIIGACITAPHKMIDICLSCPGSTRTWTIIKVHSSRLL